MFDLNLPSLMEDVARQGLVVGLVLAGAGLVFIMLGSRIFKALICISFGVVGFFIGASMPVSGPAQLGLGMLAAAGLSAASVFFTKFAVAVLAGGWVSVMVQGLVYRLGINEHVSLALTVFAFAGAVSLSFIMYHEIIAFVTSLEGSVLCLGALIIFFSQSSLMWSHFRALLLNNPVFGPFLILVGTVTGFYLQLADQRAKESSASV